MSPFSNASSPASVGSNACKARTRVTTDEVAAAVAVVDGSEAAGATEAAEVAEGITRVEVASTDTGAGACTTGAKEGLATGLWALGGGVRAGTYPPD
jgi:hypothetical protein